MPLFRCTLELNIEAEHEAEAAHEFRKKIDSTRSPLRVSVSPHIPPASVFWVNSARQEV